MDRETHHIVKTTIDPFHGHAAYPFLNAVCPGLVERLIVVDVVAGLMLGDVAELNLRLYRERGALFEGGDADSAHHMMHLPR